MRHGGGKGWGLSILVVPEEVSNRILWPTSGLGGVGNVLRCSGAGLNRTRYILPQGAGLVWPTQVGRLEVNLCRVLQHQPNDRVKRGLQLGFAPRAW